MKLFYGHVPLPRRMCPLNDSRPGSGEIIQMLLDWIDGLFWLAVVFAALMFHKAFLDWLI